MYLLVLTIHVFVLNRFGTGLCKVEFPERKFRVLIFCLQLHVQPIYIMANASEKTVLEDPPLLLKSPVWEHCGFLLKYCNGERRVSGVTV